jgi:hypothetical protein
MLRRAAAMTLVLAGLSSPAFATEWVNCADREGAASFDLLLGATEVISVAGMTITVGERVWASDVAYGPGDPVVVGQAFETPDMIIVDAVDPGVTTRIAELRLFKASEGDAFAYGGTLRVPGHGAWAVSCSGP